MTTIRYFSDPRRDDNTEQDDNEVQGYFYNVRKPRKVETECLAEIIEHMWEHGLAHLPTQDVVNHYFNTYYNPNR